jgi:hypothetical protein
MAVTVTAVALASIAVNGFAIVTVIVEVTVMLTEATAVIGGVSESVTSTSNVYGVA